MRPRWRSNGAGAEGNAAFAGRAAGFGRGQRVARYDEEESPVQLDQIIMPRRHEGAGQSVWSIGDVRRSQFCTEVAHRFICKLFS